MAYQISGKIVVLLLLEWKGDTISTPLLSVNFSACFPLPQTSAEIFIACALLWVPIMMIILIPIGSCFVGCWCICSGRLCTGKQTSRTGMVSLFYSSDIELLMLKGENSCKSNSSHCSLILIWLWNFFFYS